MLPTVHKRCLAAAFAAFLGLLAAGPAQAAPAPKLKSAYPVDSDRDGHVDGVSLRWSKAVRGGYDAKAPFAMSVRGYRVTKVGGAIGKAQHLDVARAARVRHGRVGPRLVPQRPAWNHADQALRGKRKLRSQKLDMRRFDLPVPRITCAVTLDADRDAHVDGVRLTYSRDVRSRKQMRGRFLFSVAGYKVTSVKGARGRFLQINVAEGTTPDSDVKPTIGYSRPSKRSQRKFAVRGGRRGKAFGGTYRSTRDGVSPQLIAGATGDDDHDGLLDAMTLRFSEPVKASSTAGLNVLGLQVKPAANVDGADLAPLPRRGHRPR